MWNFTLTVWMSSVTCDKSVGRREKQVGNSNTDTKQVNTHTHTMSE